MEEIRKLGTDFSERALRPRWEALDATDPVLLDEILREAAVAGIFGFAIPEAAGGSGLGVAEYTVFLEEVSRACAGVGALLAAHLIGLTPLLIENRNDLLSSVTHAEANGESALLVAAMREGRSPDFIQENIETTVERNGESYIVTGVKTNVPGAGAALCFTVLARDRNNGTLHWVVVPRNTNGVEIRPAASRMGLRLCPVNDVVFHEARVPPENMLAGFTQRGRLLDVHRFADPALAAVSIGMAVEAYDIALKYSIERYQGGKMICDHDAIRMMLSGMEVSIRASRSLAYGCEAGYLASAFAAEAAEQIGLDAVQVLGGYGYMKDYRVERILRDAKTHLATVGPRARKMESVRDQIENRR